VRDAKTRLQPPSQQSCLSVPIRHRLIDNNREHSQRPKHHCVQLLLTTLTSEEQRWPRIRRSSGVGSSRILRYFSDPESKISEKPVPELLFYFRQYQELAFINVTASSINIAKFRLHRWLLEFEQESDSQIWNISDPDSNFSNRNGVGKRDSGHLWLATDWSKRHLRHNTAK